MHRDRDPEIERGRRKEKGGMKLRDCKTSDEIIV